MAEHGRLIDADALWMNFIHNMDVCDDILEIIEKQPTIEPKTGKWIHHPDWEVDGGCGYECDQCGMGSDVDYNYCMRCGARMVQKVEEHEPTMEEFMCGQDMGNPEDGSL